MMKLIVATLAVSCCLALSGYDPTCDTSDKTLDEQNDLKSPLWDFESERPQANDNLLKPYNPQCELMDGTLSVREGFEGDWSCIVKNTSPDDYVVRVQTTENDNNPQKDGSWDFYYYAPAKQDTLANPGKGGDNEVCRLCGAKKVSGSGDWNGIKDLEQSSYDFQCRRRCQAVLYQHRNFNGQSMTVASNIASLSAFNLDNPPKVSSLKIFGKGCQLRLWENDGYNRASGQNTDPVCSFTANHDVSSWDMDAMRKVCCNSRCASGQDCFKSVSIRDTKKCGTAAFGSGTKPAGCGAKGCHRSTRNDMTAAATTDRVQALERLFKAMAQVLEE